MEAAPFFELAKAHGFITKAVPGTVLVVPGSMIFVEISLKDNEVHGLRWSLIGNKSLRMASGKLLQTIAQHRAEFAVKPYTTLAEFLMSDQ